MTMTIETAKRVSHANSSKKILASAS